jgi:hypothetical protein
VTSHPLADPRRRAFAEALGHLLAEAVWREIVAGGEHDDGFREHVSEKPADTSRETRDGEGSCAGGCQA